MLEIKGRVSQKLWENAYLRIENSKASRALSGPCTLSTNGLLSLRLFRGLGDPHSSVEVRVLCHGGTGGGQVTSDWMRMQDGGWKAAI